ncbi:hypothetical protein DFR76_103229 [Nocardia pseudobrasiliensis]|uniref:Uncharacterized protein n=2 Tax=Nocardia pseudobrasiliensis TaxID=45979 RepID=A0A370I8Y3_9NOCA|nr:hypothetical protein DFR76_103229 [Nocardia pseudobrasiliensis]
MRRIRILITAATVIALLFVAGGTAGANPPGPDPYAFLPEPLHMWVVNLVTFLVQNHLS